MKKRTGYLLRRGTVFHAIWNVGGKRFMQSTGKRDRREAMVELRRIMEPFAAGDEVTTLQNLAAKIEGRKSDLVRLDEEKNPALVMGNAWDAYVASPARPDSGADTLSHYSGHFSNFTTWLAEKHPTIQGLRDVSTEVAGQYAGHLVKRGLSGNTFNKHIRFLELLFRVLRSPGRITGNPWEDIKRKHLETKSRRELTIEELKAVCSAAKGEFRLLFAIGIYSGLRLGDCATLRWGEVDLHRGVIRRVPSKTSRRNPRPVLVPIHPELRTMMVEAAATKRGDYVLPDTAALYGNDPQALNNRLREHFEACGVTTQRPGTGRPIVTAPDGSTSREPTGKRAIVEVSFHSLRHTFVSMCREANAPLSVVEAIVGHSNPSMTRHYTHVSEAAAISAVAGLPSVMGGDANTRPALPSPTTTQPDTISRASVLAIADKLTAKSWKAARQNLLTLCR